MRITIIFLLVLLYAFQLQAQLKTEVADSLASALSEKYLNKVDNKISALNKGIEKKTLKMLNRFEKQERKIQKKLAAKDSIAATQIFDIEDRYKSVKQQITKPLSNTGLKEYIPEFDSLKTSLSFLDQSGSLTSKLPKEWGDKLKKRKLQCKGFRKPFSVGK